eukprot:CAMPEP_0113259422 /NCGR_PEP_ID=MMETSP0008_2-20120614/16345_1 /TAXON_ID=97485 /ORGANISM="Prymnesium parvum" /LENGTH=32 /DNA_ID=CAMNT_0000107943 /DNA_START=102 /DNA_END=197 /DNA_ORIENTATION=- /assembly_acc=CAM_ASM_000153
MTSDASSTCGCPCTSDEEVAIVVTQMAGLGKA